MSDVDDSDVFEDDDQSEDCEIKKSLPVNKEGRSDSSASVSEEDIADSLEIKPPQAHVHNSSSHCSCQDKHSSSCHFNVSSSHRKDLHHSQSHRDERRRSRYFIKYFNTDRATVKEELSRRSKEKRSHCSKTFYDSHNTHKISYGSRKEERFREKKPLEERLKKEKARQEEKPKTLKAELQEKLEKQRTGHKRLAKEREQQKREMHHKQLLEGEYIKQVYSHVTEESCLKRQDKERSRSRETETEVPAALVIIQPEREKQLEKADLVLSDKSISPAMICNQKEEKTSQKDVDQSDGSLYDNCCDDSDSILTLIRFKNMMETVNKVLYTIRLKDIMVSLNKPYGLLLLTDLKVTTVAGDSDDSDIGQEKSPPILVPNYNVDEEIEFIKDSLPPYLPAIQGCRSVEEFQCLNRFVKSEVKCLMQQLLCAVAHLHYNWILHRDLKTSNLLLSNKGILKVGDFGLAREYGSPLKPYTPMMVTLWYRAPELLLSAKEYSTPVDMWSVGCIFAELLSMEPLFPGKPSQIDQLNCIFKTLGTPNESIWPGYSNLPIIQKITFAEFAVSQLHSRYGGILTNTGINLLNGFLTYNPGDRITAEKARKHEYFSEHPLAVDPAMFPRWPAKSESGPHKANTRLKPPSSDRDYKKLRDDTDEGFRLGTGPERTKASAGPGFSLKF
ncbi:uncharacterized protein LOC142319914 [Lycorma delicatula]|uniref:uncharacterized protein LOC142319914 n=1 Tax=Lycorma delicatula TaxID=130591 RepID=UPI003F5125B8